jgi:hypothetical protein
MYQLRGTAVKLHHVFTKTTMELLGMCEQARCHANIPPPPPRTQQSIAVNFAISHHSSIYHW